MCRVSVRSALGQGSDTQASALSPELLLTQLCVPSSHAGTEESGITALGEVEFLQKEVRARTRRAGTAVPQSSVSRASPPLRGRPDLRFKVALERPLLHIRHCPSACRPHLGLERPGEPLLQIRVLRTKDGGARMWGGSYCSLPFQLLLSSQKVAWVPGHVCMV